MPVDVRKTSKVRKVESCPFYESWNKVAYRADCTSLLLKRTSIAVFVSTNLTAINEKEFQKADSAWCEFALLRWLHTHVRSNKFGIPVVFVSSTAQVAFLLFFFYFSQVKEFYLFWLPIRRTISTVYIRVDKCAFWQELGIKDNHNPAVTHFLTYVPEFRAKKRIVKLLSPPCLET